MPRSSMPSPSAAPPHRGRPRRRGRWPAVLALLLIGITLAAFAWRRSSRAQIRREPGLSVLLITIDTLRADALGAYGNASVETPLIDRLAAGGVRFENAHAQNVVTLPSHANILSGSYPIDHGVHENAGFRFPAGTATIATILKAQGYATGAFVSAFPLDSRFGLTHGFDVYDDRYGDADSHTAFRMQERRGSATVAAAVDWLKSIGSRRSFCWVHLYDPHFPYDPPEPFASRFRSQPYYGEVSASDEALRPLLGPILNDGDRGRTLVVLTADHGESLGEHGEVTHGIFAYEGTLRVPLILYAPRLLRPQALDASARHVDILPTILDALGLPPAGGAGRSLLPVVAGTDEAPPVAYFEALSASLNRGWAPLRGVIRGNLKYLDLPIPELYDLGVDPHETRNLVASESPRANEMRALLAALRKGERVGARERESAEVRERLKSLGYVSGTAAPRNRYTDDDDPKRLIALDADVQNVITRYQAGDLPGATALCQDVLRRRPRMPLALMYLSFLYRAAGDLQRSVEIGRTALEQSPDDPDITALVGAYLTEAGFPAEAVQRLQPYAAGPDPDLDVLNTYGVALASAGREREAIAAFERARALDPSNAMALVNIGTIHLLKRDTQTAERLFESALRIDDSVARAHNSLGVIAAERGRDDDALAHWKRAAALDPHDYQMLYNMGKLLVRVGRPAEARPYLERYLQEAPPSLERRDIDNVRRWLEADARSAQRP